MVDRLLTFAMSLGVLLVVMALGGLLVASRAVVEDMPFAAEIRCAVGLDAPCLQREIAALEADLEVLEAQRQAFQGGAAVRTETGDLGGFYASVAAIYDDPATRTGLRAAICEAARDVGGRDPTMLLGRFINGQIEAEPFDPDLGNQLGITAADAARGLAACPWPTPN
ncbi:MAG: hypothetical protein AAF317_02320 [Pseudomonadota bacterium]